MIEFEDDDPDAPEGPSDDAFNRMFGAFEKVDPAEGFDEIVSVDNRELLQKLANSGEAR